jgi:LmbE family N-acetylglucosaminyl deacetylase
MSPHRVRKVYYNVFIRERMVEMREEARKQGQDFLPGGNAATIPFEEMGTPMADVTTFVKLSDAAYEAKRASMAAHATQLPADGPFASATAEQLRQFMGTEVFQLTRPPISVADYPRPEDDLFAGL